MKIRHRHLFSYNEDFFRKETLIADGIDGKQVA